MLTTNSALTKDQRNAKASDVMQHRHFAVVAGIIANLNIDYQQRSVIAHQFACGLTNTNPRFNRARFIKACGVN